MGRMVAHWMMHGSSDLDVTGIHINRLHPYQATPEYRSARTPESLGMVYQCHYPYKLNVTARGVKRSPLHARTQALGANFRSVSGFEMPDYYTQTPDTETGTRTNGDKWWGGVPGWGRPPFWGEWEREHHVCRNEVGVIDMSFMSKFWVEGVRAGELLDRVSTASVDGDVGRVVYTQWLNAEGKLEGDVTVTKLKAHTFLVIVTDSMHRHAEAHLQVCNL